MADFTVDGFLAKAKLKPGTYRLFTDANEDMPWGGPVSGTEFTVLEQATGDGAPGKDGKSTYQLWLDAGHTGDMAAFFASLTGEPGKDGEDGVDGSGAGTPGKSAYDLWVALPGNAGKTLAQFLDSLKGEPGKDGAPGTSGGGTTQDPAQFVSILQAAWDADRPLNWNGGDVTITQPIVLLANSSKFSFGLNMNEATIHCAFNNPAAYALTFQINNGGLNFREFSIKEVGFSGSAFAGGICFRCRRNDSWIYSFALSEIDCAGHTEHAVWFDGSVFEFQARSLRSTNGKGLVRATCYQTAGGLALPSAMVGSDWRPRDFYGHAVQFDGFVLDGSRNDNAAPFDLRLTEGYFVTGLGAGNGIYAPSGITQVEGVGFENLGGIAMYVGYRGARVYDCQASNPRPNQSATNGMGYLVQADLAGGSLVLRGSSFENENAGSGLRLAKVTDLGGGRLVLDPSRSSKTGADIDHNLPADRVDIVSYL